MDATGDAGHNRSPEEVDRRYMIYLIVAALAGWSLASYDLNLLTLTLPDIRAGLGLSNFAVGACGFIVYAAQFTLTLFVGYGMDTMGRKWMWVLCLSGSAIFTGLTFFVHNYGELAVVRALASGLAFSELAVSITIVNEQVTARCRGLLYSIVQGGWPLGVFLASGVYLAFIGSALWTILSSVTTPIITWLIVAVGLALGQWMTLLLRKIPPGQELEEIATWSGPLREPHGHLSALSGQLLVFS